MAAGFGGGLVAGLLGGFAQAQQRKDDLARAEKQQDMERYLQMATAPGLPDETRQWALSQVQALSQGKKAGKGGPLHPMFLRLSRVIGLAHGGADQDVPGGVGGTAQSGAPLAQPVSQSPWSERLPDGTPALEAGLPASARTPQPGSASTPQQLPGYDPSAARMQPGSQTQVSPPSVSRETSGGGYQKVLENRVANWENQVRTATDPWKRMRAQEQLDLAQKALDTHMGRIEVETGRAESAAEVARIRADQVRETAQLRADQQMELQRIRDSDAKDKVKEIENLRAQHAKELEDLRAQHQKDLEAVRIKGREDVKKTAPGVGASGASNVAEAMTNGPDHMRSAVMWELMTGQKPAFGLGKSAQRDAYNAERTRVLEEIGPTGAADLRTQFHSGQAGLTWLTRNRATIGAFENAFQLDLGNARDAAANVPRGDARLFNNWKQLAQANLTNNPELAKFRVATQTAINQYARLMYSATGGGTSTDTARQHAEDLLNTAMAKGAYGAALDQMELEAKNRTAGIDTEIQRQQSQISSGRGGAAQPLPPKIGTVEDGHRFKGGNPADPKNWELVK